MSRIHNEDHLDLINGIAYTVEHVLKRDYGLETVVDVLEYSEEDYLEENYILYSIKPKNDSEINLLYDRDIEEQLTNQLLKLLGEPEGVFLNQETYGLSLMITFKMDRIAFEYAVYRFRNHLIDIDDELFRDDEEELLLDLFNYDDSDLDRAELEGEEDYSDIDVEE